LLFKPSGAKEFPGADQVMHQTNQVMHTTPKGLARTLPRIEHGVLLKYMQWNWVF